MIAPLDVVAGERGSWLVRELERRGVPIRSPDSRSNNCECVLAIGQPVPGAELWIRNPEQPSSSRALPPKVSRVEPGQALDLVLDVVAGRLSVETVGPTLTLLRGGSEYKEGVPAFAQGVLVRLQRGPARAIADLPRRSIETLDRKLRNRVRSQLQAFGDANVLVLQATTGRVFAPSTPSFELVDLGIPAAAFRLDDGVATDMSPEVWELIDQTPRKDLPHYQELALELAALALDQDTAFARLVVEGARMLNQSQATFSITVPTGAGPMRVAGKRVRRTNPEQWLLTVVIDTDNG